MTEPVIEKNVPLPKKNTWTEVLNRMEIGESIEIPFEKRGSLSNLISVKFHKLTEKRFTLSYKDEPKGKARIWRIENADETVNN